MKINTVIKIYIFAATLIMATGIQAQSLRKTYVDVNSKISIVTEPRSTKLGRGILSWIYTEGDGIDFAHQRFMSCDGKFISDEIFTLLSVKEKSLDRQSEILIDIRKMQPPSTHAATIEEFELSEFQHKFKFRAILKELCANSTPERRNNLIPFFKSNQNKDKESSVSSIVSGTFNRRGSVVEGWIRSHEVVSTIFKKSNGENLMKSDGTPYEYDVLKDESYKMDMLSVNCAEGEFDFIQSAQYGKNKELIKSNDFGKPVYKKPIPQTMGDTVVRTFCSIY